MSLAVEPPPVCSHRETVLETAGDGVIGDEQIENKDREMGCNKKVRCLLWSIIKDVGSWEQLGMDDDKPLKSRVLECCILYRIYV